jgi:PBSX family phage portal protein
MIIDEDEDKTVITPTPVGVRNRVVVDDVADPFSISGESLKKVRGMDATVKRRQTRHMQKAFTGQDGAASKREETESEVDAYNLFSVVLPKYNLDYLAKIYEMSSPHFSAVNAKVANIAGLGYDFVESHVTRRKIEQAETQEAKDKIRKKLGRIKEDLYDWLDDCNDEDTFMETLIKVWIDYETTGNGYIEVGRTLAGEVGYIGHIPSSTMRIRKDRDGYVQMVANRVKFFRNFGDLEQGDPIGNDPMPNEIIHLKKYSPTGQFYGVPDIVAAQQAIVGNEFAARFNLDYFENKAVPRYVIVLKGASLSTTGAQNILEFFETGLKGKNHRTLYVPLPADDTERKTSFEMKPVEAGTQDSSFVNYRRGNLSDILMAHRVPINKVSLSEGVSLAASRDADKTFKEQVCRPQQKILEKKLSKIISSKTDIFNLKLNELSLTDEDTQSKIDERYLRFGVLVPNEPRRRMGMDNLPNGDKTFLEAQGEQAESLAQQQAEQQAQTMQSRTRDQDRSANATDSNGEGRNAQGDGRAQA